MVLTTRLMFDELFHTLGSLHVHTALLEACDWDEERVEYLITLVTERLRDADPETPLEQHIIEALEDETTPDQLQIITQLVMMNANKIWKEVSNPHHWN